MLYSGRHFGEKSSLQVPAPGTRYFHNYDPDTGELSFAHHSVSIPAVVAEVQRITPLVEKLAYAPFRPTTVSRTAGRDQ